MVNNTNRLSLAPSLKVHAKPALKNGVLLSCLLAYLFIYVFSIGEIVISSAVLAYSVGVYRGGYIKSNPQLVAISGLTFVTITFLLFCGTVRRRVAIWMELLALAIYSGLWFFSLIRMHVATPGLLFHCGGFPICKGWITMLVVAWLAWGSTIWAMATLVVGGFYARTHPNMHIKESVWLSYAGHYFDPTFGNRLSMMTIRSQEPNNEDLFSREIKGHFKERNDSIDQRSQFTIE